MPDGCAPVSKVAVTTLDVPPRSQPSLYPPPFAARMTGRIKRALGDVFGLSNFGVNLTELAPGAVSSLRHGHSHQDESQLDGITVRLHWTDAPYRWHVNDGAEVFTVLEGRVEMRWREAGEEHRRQQRRPDAGGPVSQLGNGHGGG